MNSRLISSFFVFDGALPQFSQHLVQLELLLAPDLVGEGPGVESRLLLSGQAVYLSLVVKTLVPG